MRRIRTTCSRKSGSAEEKKKKKRSKSDKLRIAAYVLLYIGAFAVMTIPFRAIWYWLDYYVVRPEKYALTSFPWHTSLVVDAVITGGVFLVLIILHLILLYLADKKEAGRHERQQPKH